jgi:DNA-binding ferritin-like protein
MSETRVDDGFGNIQFLHSLSACIFSKHFVMASVGRFISVLMHSRTQTHVYHLDTKSFALHKALEAYYTSIVPLLDKYAETFKGKYGAINRMSPMLKVDRNPKNAVLYLTKLLDVINKMKLPRDAPLRNIQDEITGLISATIYMSRNLR